MKGAEAATERALYGDGMRTNTYGEGMRTNTNDKPIESAEPIYFESWNDYEQDMVVAGWINGVVILKQ